MVKQPWWKWLWSQFADIQLEKRTSEFSGELQLAYSRGRYLLTTQDAVYSYEDLYLNFRRSFEQIPLEKYPWKTVLLLGLGLGSVPMMLEKIHRRNYQYTCVEIDEQVIELAKKYTLPGLQSPVELLCEDAYTYVLNTSKNFDLVIVDLFIDTEVPSKFETLDFLEALKGCLAENGLLLYNRMTATEETNQQNTQFFNSVFKKTFPNADYLSIRGNKMLLNERKA